MTFFRSSIALKVASPEAPVGLPVGMFFGCSRSNFSSDSL
jgi:hypothetical protein